MNPHPRAAAVVQASEDIGIALTGLQQKHGLTDAEMLLTVTMWQTGKLEEIIQAEREREGS